MYELKKWQLNCRGEKVIARGRCYGNPKFHEGCFIHTSPVMKAELSEEKIVLTTRSGSHYELSFGEIDESEKELTGEAAEALGLSLDMERCLSLWQQARERKREYLAEILNPSEMYIKLDGELMAEEAFYRTGQGEIIELIIRRHMGMFTDSVIVGGLEWNRRECSCEWRYMICGSGISVYFWNGQLDVVRIFHEGPDFVAGDLGREILCRRNEITAVERLGDESY